MPHRYCLLVCDAVATVRNGVSKSPNLSIVDDLILMSSYADIVHKSRTLLIFVGRQMQMMPLEVSMQK